MVMVGCVGAVREPALQLPLRVATPRWQQRKGAAKASPFQEVVRSPG